MHSLHERSVALGCCEGSVQQVVAYQGPWASFLYTIFKVMQGSAPCCGWHPRAQPTSNMSEHALQQISIDGRDTCTQANLLNRNGCRWRDPYDNEADVGLVMQSNGSQTDGQEARHADNNRKQSRRVFQTRRPRVCNCVLEPKVAHATVFWDVLYQQCTYHNVQDETCQRMHVEQHVGCTRMRARVECSGTLPYHPFD